METPPSTGPHRLNYMHFRRGQHDEDNRHDALSKFGPKYHFSKKQPIAFTAERQNINKIMSDMKKHITYLDSTRWMYENNGDMNPSEHLSHNNI